MATTLLNKLEAEGLSLYVEKAGVLTFASDRRGIRPLLRGVTEFGSAFDQAQVADRVVGLGAAYLLIYGKVAKVCALVATEEAVEILESRGVEVEAQSVIKGLKEKDASPCEIDELARGSGGVALFLDKLQRHVVS